MDDRNDGNFKKRAQMEVVGLVLLRVLAIGRRPYGYEIDHGWRCMTERPF